METNINIIAGRKESEAGIRFGTIATAPFWIDGKDESIDADGQEVRLENSNRADPNQLTWNIADGKLIQSNLCARRRWGDLSWSDLILGSRVTIDGLLFNAQIPCIDEDTALCGKFEMPKHSYWAYSNQRKEQQSFTLTPGPKPEPIVVCGPANEYLRLILIPINPELKDLVGKRVRMILDHGGSSCIITASLDEVDAYDITCSRVQTDEGKLANTFVQWNADLETLYISRDAVIAVGEVPAPC